MRDFRIGQIINFKHQPQLRFRVERAEPGCLGVWSLWTGNEYCFDPQVVGSILKDELQALGPLVNCREVNPLTVTAKVIRQIEELKVEALAREVLDGDRLTVRHSSSLLQIYNYEARALAADDVTVQLEFTLLPDSALLRGTFGTFHWFRGSAGGDTDGTRPWSWLERRSRDLSDFSVGVISDIEIGRFNVAIAKAVVMQRFAEQIERLVICSDCEDRHALPQTLATIQTSFKYLQCLVEEIENFSSNEAKFIQEMRNLNWPCTARELRLPTSAFLMARQGVRKILEHLDQLVAAESR